MSDAPDPYRLPRRIAQGFTAVAAVVLVVVLACTWTRRRMRAEFEAERRGLQQQLRNAQAENAVLKSVPPTTRPEE